MVAQITKDAFWENGHYHWSTANCWGASMSPLVHHIKDSLESPDLNIQPIVWFVTLAKRIARSVFKVTLDWFGIRMLYIFNCTDVQWESSQRTEGDTSRSKLCSSQNRGNKAGLLTVLYKMIVNRPCGVSSYPASQPQVSKLKMQACQNVPMRTRSSCGQIPLLKPARPISLNVRLGLLGGASTPNSNGQHE